MYLGYKPIFGITIVKEKRLAPYLCAIIVLACGCVTEGPGGSTVTTSTTTSTTLPSVISSDCGSLMDMIKALLNEANYCINASDCIISDLQPGCPFGCYLLVNKNASLEGIRGCLETYQDECPQCEYKCMTTPEEGDIGCIGGKCTDVRYAPKTTTTTTTTTLYGLNEEGCKKLRYGMRDLMEKVNYCKTDEDCIAPDLELGCPFGCYVIMNRNESLTGDGVAALIKAAVDYHRSCPLCEQICLAPPGQKDLKCRKSRCADVQLDPASGVEWTLRLDINDSLPKSVVVHEDGLVEYLEGSVSHNTTIGHERVDALKQTAVESGFFQLNGEYRGSRCCDFIPHTITVYAGDRTVRVYCYNQCPDGFEVLKEAIKDAWLEEIDYQGFA